MFKLPPSDSPLRELFELADLVPIMQGEVSGNPILPSLQYFTNQSRASIQSDRGVTAIFGFCKVIADHPRDDKIVLVRCELNSTEILWTFN